MSEYEPIDLERDSKRLINELIDVGRTAGLFVSRAAMDYGDYDPRTKMFDVAAQRVTLVLLKLHADLDKIADYDDESDPAYD